jgi:hypothetical protein
MIVMLYMALLLSCPVRASFEAGLRALSDGLSELGKVVTKFSPGSKGENLRLQAATYLGKMEDVIKDIKSYVNKLWPNADNVPLEIQGDIKQLESEASALGKALEKSEDALTSECHFTLGFFESDVKQFLWHLEKEKKAIPGFLSNFSFH